MHHVARVVRRVGGSLIDGLRKRLDDGIEQSLRLFCGTDLEFREFGHVADDDDHAHLLAHVPQHGSNHVQLCHLVALEVRNEFFVDRVGIVDGVEDGLVEFVVFFVPEKEAREFFSFHLRALAAQDLFGGVVHVADGTVKTDGENAFHHVLYDIPAYEVAIVVFHLRKDNKNHQFLQIGRSFSLQSALTSRSRISDFWSSR